MILQQRTEVKKSIQGTAVIEVKCRLEGVG